MSSTIEAGVGTEDIRKDTVFGRIGGALREREFRWWFAGQITSASGVMAQGVALSWWMLQRTGDAVWLSVLTVCTMGPTLIGGAWAGAVVDHADRRRLLIGTQTVLMGIAAALTVLAATDTLAVWNVLVASVLAGTTMAVDSPARQVYVVDLVGADGVASAVGLWEVALNTSRVVGPGLGGALLAGPGATACFGVNAFSYLAPLIVLLRMKPRTTAQVRTRGRARGAARDGIRYAFRSPVIRALLPMSTASGLIFGMGIALPPLVQRALHQGGGGYGAMMAAFGVGGLPGALLAAAQPEPTGRRVRWLALATAAAVIGTAVAPVMAVALVGMVALGLTSIWFIASANTLAQLRCAPDMRGRVMSLWGVAMMGTAPITGFGVAAVVQYVGPREGFSISGIALGLAAVVGWRALRD
ncbi:major facilitator superfamily MFS_1 [Catenulispora acidiphila DSM 44928]|uniref:Major facilitator superfamily MFS_1 n=1 Tax=Catenulispora acidiphila (strain DSM 44928 / JCM 14897 / NBRC 102108 / NRRL B-24433 / ID139908) TaxID=479433 RepID=C7PZ68_CATAD|nr:MFS transporter [Catenulispora acidiphila]ACU69624.1 major facilitator superfamily MFS_1 [Catenulispora acidiphila DSM 44928]